MQKANQLDEIDAAVNKFEPVTPEDAFYVNFEHLRGDFQSRDVTRILNVTPRNGHYYFNYQPNRNNKTLLFLAGMRGSGKTSELAKYAQQLNSPECFFVVTCNVDEELDMDKVQYMDILIFQLEKLLSKAADVDLAIDDTILDSMNVWFQERVNEINRNLKAEGNVELEVGNDDSFSITSLLGKLIGVTTKLKLGLSGSYERAMAIRTNIKNRFPDFSLKFNTFIEQVNEQLRREGKGQEILFIVDGLEKTMSAETRRAIIMDESNRIRQIRANTLFTLPIELMKEEQRIRNFSEIITFPFIKIVDRDGSEITAAIERFEEFVCKRVNEALFDSMDTVHLAIRYSGGSPRQLLRIIEQAGWLADISIGKITRENMERAIEKLGNATARYLETTDFELLKKLRADLEAGHPIGFDSSIQNLLEKEIIFEYNDGTYKRVNPLLETSKLYQHRVLDQV
ncbi:hypothetical protein [Spirosoma sp. KUDC1026]|uniref:hypothetical protein n=1 Tax=Spirosoma sp. KUDC1026 TaxID=2745947 RepID=UPI00159BD554|nr:hypothetical protein [Spirosoma sp. KUDC1026]QKZ15052.1 hypothetical protein HU175_21480 [Spirosoma sp. KUDC1026]